MAATVPARRTLLWAGALLVAATGLVFVVYHGVAADHDQFDLHIYFAAVHWWSAGNDLYGYGIYDPVMGVLGFTYPPFAALVMSPMALASWPVVQVLAIAAILAGAAVTVHLVLAQRIRIRSHMLLPVVAGVTLVSFLLLPIRQTFQLGQINLFLAVLVLGDLLVFTRRGSRLAGAGVGLAMAIKVVPGIFLLYLVLARQWRATAVAAGTCAAAWLLGAAVAPAASWNYFTSLLWDTRRVGVMASPSNQSVDGLLARFAAPGQPSTPLFLVAVVLVTFVVARRIRIAAACGDTLAAVTITGLLGVLLSPISWIHHCIWVLPALVIIAHRLVLDGRQVVAGIRPPGPASPESRAGDVAAVGAHDPHRRLARRMAGNLALGICGLVVFVPDITHVLGMPMQHLTDLSLVQVLGTSLPVLWIVVATLTLPLLPAGQHSGSSRSGPPARSERAGVQNA